MQARLIRRPYMFVKLDALSVVLYPVLGVALLSVFGVLLIKVGLIKGFYSSPFVALCALISNRVCVRAGMVAAVLSVLAHDFVFVAPLWELNWPTMDQSTAYLFCFAVAYLVGRRTVMGPPLPHVTQLSVLPFEKSRGNEKSFWSVESANDWTEDSRVGQTYGRMYIEQLRSSHFVPPLGWIIRDMVAKGRWTGVEAGFIGALGMAARTRTGVAAGGADGHDADDRGV